MATREEVYEKFGVTAEAAQLFETELGTLLLGISGLREGWHVKPDGERARIVLENIQRNTLGGLFSTLRKHSELSEDIEARMISAVKARNRLNHGFFEKHNFSIQTNHGRDAMLADLEVLHDELFNAWQLASAMTQIMMRIVKDTGKKKPD